MLGMASPAREGELAKEEMVSWSPSTSGARRLGELGRARQLPPPPSRTCWPPLPPSHAFASPTGCLFAALWLGWEWPREVWHNAGDGHPPPNFQAMLHCKSPTRRLHEEREVATRLGRKEERASTCGPHALSFFLTMMPHQRNQGSILPWDRNCTVLYSLGWRFLILEIRDVNKTRRKVKGPQMNLFQEKGPVRITYSIYLILSAAMSFCFQL